MMRSSPKGKSEVSKPVKVFILMGQSNMLGFGKVNGDEDGTLEFTVKKKKRFTHLIDGHGDWTSSRTVRNVRMVHQFKLCKNEWLRVNEKHIGPEIQIGHILGTALGEQPILLLKSCVGNRSLGWDLLPPGSKSFEGADGFIYAGYKDSPERWKKGTKPVPINWYGGKQYDDDMANIKRALSDIETYFPGATKYEISGIFWWQGHKDSFNSILANNYEKNLVCLIKALRNDLNAPNAKFACATVAFKGRNMKGPTLAVAEAQLAVSGERGKYPEFSGNVKTVDVRSSWRNSGPNKRAGHHYFCNAETVMEVGDALGRAMLDLLDISI